MSVFDKLYTNSSKSNETAEPTTVPDKPTRRTPTESEDDLTAPYVVDGYRTQISTITDENGEITEVPWGTKGSRRPDAADFDSDHVRVVEVKNYDVSSATGRNNLVRNIRQQTDKTLEDYGDDVEITEVIDLRGQDVTIEDMEKLTKKLEDKVPEVGIDYRW